MKNMWERIADTLIGHSLQLRAGERVYIQVSGDIAGDLVELLLERILQDGGIPVLRQRSTKQLKAMIKHASIDQFQQWAEFDRREIESSDAYIGIQAEQNSFEWNGCGAAQIEHYRTYYSQPVHMAMASLNKWVLFKHPTYAMAQTAGMSSDELMELYRLSCGIDYGEWSRKAALLGQRLERTSRVRIVSPGTELCFSIEGIPHYICDGKYNLPDGEVFTAPVVSTVSGQITFNIPARYMGQSYGEATCRFAAGELVEVSGVGAAQLRSILYSDAGASRIGEFGIGLNPYIHQPTGSLNFDEKMGGSIHLAFGQAFPMAYNGNDSSIHFDMVLSQRAADGGGELYFDDELVRKDGMFITSDLKGLNDG